MKLTRILLIATATLCFSGCIGRVRTLVASTPDRKTGAGATRSELLSELHMATSPDEFDAAFPVAPALDLVQWATTYEKDPAIDKPSTDLKKAESQWLELQKGGKTLWGSENWMKNPGYYGKLSTRQLAQECFERPIIATELTIFNDPSFGLQRAKVFHTGFAELLGRKDLADGILYALEQSALVIANPASHFDQVVRASMNIEALCILPRLSPVRERIKGNEATFLLAYAQVLKSYKVRLDARTARSDEPLGFFREPCSVAIMALIFLKQIDLTRYEAIAPHVRRVRFPRTQRVQDLRAYCDMILSYLMVESTQRE
ncbi:MAG: hypothetical protein KAH23_09475 [Kiritimatiellae bacterium]|nr:hypothetical protein [Kiritimatiellia bacterium]